MARLTLTGWAEQLFSRFPRFRRQWGSRFVWGIAATGDIFLEACEQAMVCRFIVHAPEDALPYLGRDRRLIRGPAELAASFRARLVAAWVAWEWAGTKTGVLGQLVAFGFKSDTASPDIIESQDTNWPPRSSWWSRFWVVIPEGCHPYSGGVPPNDQENIRRIVRQFRSGEVVCERAVVVQSGRLAGWPRDGYTVGDAENDGLTVGDCVGFYIGDC